MIPVMKQRRRTPRCPFPAAAQIILDGLVASAKVVDLSLNGCGLVMSPAAPRGTVMKVKIMADGQYFDATGKVAHCSPNGGTGIVFQAVQPVFLFPSEVAAKSVSKLNLGMKALVAQKIQPAAAEIISDFRGIYARVARN